MWDPNCCVIASVPSPSIVQNLDKFIRLNIVVNVSPLATGSSPGTGLISFNSICAASMMVSVNHPTGLSRICLSVLVSSKAGIHILIFLLDLLLYVSTHIGFSAFRCLVACLFLDISLAGPLLPIFHFGFQLELVEVGLVRTLVEAVAALVEMVLPGTLGGALVATLVKVESFLEEMVGVELVGTLPKVVDVWETGEGYNDGESSGKKLGKKPPLSSGVLAIKLAPH